MPYEVVRYAAVGHEGETNPANPAWTDGAVVCRGGLGECFVKVLFLVGITYNDAVSKGFYWHAGSVRGIKESLEEGSGGWKIRPAMSD